MLCLEFRQLGGCFLILALCAGFLSATSRAQPGSQNSSAKSAFEELASRLLAEPDEERRRLLLDEDRSLVKPELVDALIRLGGRIYFSPQPDYAKAIDAYRLAAFTAEKVGDRIRAANALRYAGAGYRRQGLYAEALDHYQQSLKVSQAIDDRTGIAGTYNSMGEVYALKGEYPLAREYYEQSLDLRKAIGNPAEIASSLVTLGLWHYQQGDMGKALELYREAVELRQKLLLEKPDNTTNRYELAHLRNNMGLAYAELGDYRRALSHHEESQSLAREAKREISGLLRNFGAVHERQGNYQLALEFYQKDLAASERRGEQLFVIHARLEIGRIHQLQNKHSEAMVEFGEALSAAGKIGHQDLISKAHHNIGISFHLQRDYNQALEHYRQSLAIRDKLNDREGIADTRHNISITQAERGHFSGAVEFAEPAGALAKQIGKRELIWRIYTTLGRVRLALNQPDKAKEAFDEAIKAIEEMRANVAGGEQQLQAFFENKTAPYIGQVDLLLAQGRKEEALGYAERAKGRALLNVLQGGKVNVAAAMTPAQQERELGLKNEIAAFNTKLYQERMRQRPDEKRLAELDGKLRQAQLGYEKFQVELYAAHPELKIKRGESPPLTLAEAGVLLPDNRTVLLSFVAAEEKTLLFLLTRPAATSAPQLDVYSLPVKREEIAERIGKFRQALAGNKPGFGKEARALHDLLLGRAQPQLRGKDKFVIVPDGALWELPFQALMTGGGRYLWQEGAIAYAPSLTVLREMAKARRERSNRSAATLLAIGDPALGKEVIERQKTLMGTTLEQMPEAVQQVQSLKQLYGPKRSKVFIRAEATEAQVKAEAARHGILHLAAHGVLNDRSPMYSHIVLAQTAGDAKIGEEGGEQGQEEDGLLEAWELMKMDLQADLAVLSACETARGRVSAGEGMIGLTWALFVAGVPTTVVSQWSVRSDSTARLMVEFHRQLRRSPAAGKNSSAPVTKAEALRNAALTLMKDASYGHPFHWAGFVVMGDGFDGDVKNAEDKSKIVRRDK